MDNRLDWVGRLIWNFRKMSILTFFESWVLGKRFIYFLTHELKIKSWSDPVLIPSLPRSFALAGVTMGDLCTMFGIGLKIWVSTQTTPTLKRLKHVLPLRKCLTDRIPVQIYDGYIWHSACGAAPMPCGAGSSRFSVARNERWVVIIAPKAHFR